MQSVAVIPARMDSTRYPGKPLCDIQGMSMIEHVYRRTSRCEALDETYVATPDAEIREEVVGFGGSVIMTGPHDRAIDRVAEAAESVESDIVTVVQGDEPLVYPDMISAAIEPLREDQNLNVTTMIKEIEDPDVFVDPNFPKVVVDAEGNILYFSREPIPNRHAKSFDKIRAFKHLAVIPFRREYLFTFSELAQTPLEKAESIDLLRALEHGHTVRAVEVDRNVYQVDTPEDHEAVNELITEDELFNQYRQ